MDFPRNVYKSPGSLLSNKGRTYDTILVQDKKEFNAALKAGYLESYRDALLGEPEPEPEIEAENEDMIPDPDDF